MKTPDMSVFVGQNFDMEFANQFPARSYRVDRLEMIMKGSDGVRKEFYASAGGKYWGCRPRLNHKQVLDDYSWLPDGFVCKVAWIDPPNATAEINTFTSKEVADTVFFSDWLWVEFIGVTPDYAEWGESVGLPVIAGLGVES